MSVIELDFFDPDDPNGAALGQLTDEDCESIEIYVQHRGLGHISFVVDRDKVAPALVANGNLVKAKIPVISASYVAAAWLDEGLYRLLNRRGEKVIQYGGPGPLGILRHHVLYHSSTVADQPARGSADQPGLWWWTNEPYGAIATRVIEEGRNAAIGDPAGADSPLQHVSIDFSRTLDSASQAWTNIAEEFQVQVGADALSVLYALQDAGDFTLVASPNLLIQAFETYGTDRTSATYASGKVRITSDNIMTDIQRRARGAEVIDHLLGRDSEGSYFTAVAPEYVAGKPARWGFLDIPETNDDTLLTKLAQQYMADTRRALEVVKVEVAPGNDPLTGLYLPFLHYNVGDDLTIHTGTGTHDFNNASALLSGIRVVAASATDDASDDNRRRSLRVHLEFNDTAADYAPSRATDPTASHGSGPQSSSHTHLDHLCRPPRVPNLYAAAIGTSMPDPVTIGTGVTGGTGRSLYAIVYVTHGGNAPAIGAVTYSPTNNHTGDFAALTLVERTTPSADALIDLYRLDNPAAGTATASVKASITGDGAIGVFYADSATIRDFVTDTSTPSLGTSSSVSIAAQPGDLRLDLGGWVEVNASPVDAPVPGAGQTSQGTSTRNQSAGQPDFGAGISSSTLNTVTWSFAASRPWYAGIIALVGDAGDNPQPVGGNSEAAVGTSIRQTRCDHVHPHGDQSAKTTETHHHASSVKFTPTGSVAATNVQAAIAEVASEGVQATIVDAKGDLIVATAADTVARLAAPANGGRWVADSAQASGWRSVLDKYDATAAPTVNDDSGAGFSIGSKWVDVTNDREYVALDVTVGAAVWKETTSTGTGGGVTVQDEGTPLATTADTLNFTGAGVTASGTGATKTINIPGGGGGLSAAKAWVEDESDGRDIPATAGSIDNEFNSTTLTGTALGTPDTIDSDTTAQGKLYIRRAAGTAFSLVGRYWAWTPTNGASVITRIADARLGDNFQRYALLVAEATPAATRGIYLESDASEIRRISTVSTTGLAAGVASITAGPAVHHRPPVLLKITYVNSTTLRFYYSYEGDIWTQVGGDHTHALTIASAALAVTTQDAALDAEATFNFIRSV